MELQIAILFPLLIPFMLFLFMILRTNTSSSGRRPNLPPGPPKLPLIGNMHQIIGYAPHYRLRDLALEHGPLMHLQLGEVPHLVVSSPEAAKEVLRTHGATFLQRPEMLVATILAYNRKDIAFSDGDYWRQLRKICAVELLSAKRVQSFRTIRDQEVKIKMRSLYDASISGEPINLTLMLKSLTSSIISRAAFGELAKELRDEFALLKISEAFSGVNFGDFFPSIGFLSVVSGIKSKLVKIHRDIDRVIEGIINEHKEARQRMEGDLRGEADNLIDVLLDLQEANELDFSLTTESIKAIILDMFVGGSDTTTNTLDWIFSELMRHPQVMEKLQAEVRNSFNEKAPGEMTYLNAVIKESLRLHPPGPLLIPRVASEATTINGYDIAAKTKVLVNAWAIGRDPRFWSEPERFEPERFVRKPDVEFNGTQFEYIPFGSGRRSCPGVLFAVSSISDTVANFVYHFDWKLPTGIKPEDIDMSELVEAGKRTEPLYLIPVAAQK